MPPFGDHPARRPAIVTGASSGIGEAAARLWAAAGHPVLLAARRVERCEATAAAIRESGGEAVAAALDLTDPSSIDALVATAEAEFGPIEVVVSNAGEVFPSRAHETEPDDFAQQVQVNLLGAQHLIQRITPGMIERERGDIVVVTSDVVRTPRPRMSSYVTSKWGLEGLARAMQMELEGTGVRVSVVSPGPTLTGQGSTWDGEAIDQILAEWSRFGLMRHGGYLRPEDVAATVVAVAGVPRGTHLTLVEVQPEAPVQPTADPPPQEAP